MNAPRPEFPSPDEDFEIDPTTVEFVNEALTSGHLVVHTFTCETCEHTERRLEKEGSSHTVYCPTPKCREAGRAMWRGRTLF